MAISLLAAGSFLAGCAYVDRRADQREAAAELLYPPEGQILNVAGRRVHAVVAGQGPDLVLIHGAGGNTRDFTFRIVERLAERYRVIAFDRPGHGFTDVAPAARGAFNTASETPGSQARLLQAAAAQLGADRPVVLGQSYGGAVALAWALERPEALSALVLVAAASEPWEGGLSSFYTVNGSALGGGTVVPLITAFATDAQARDTVRMVFRPQEPPEGYIDHFGVGLATRRASIRANTRQVNALHDNLKEMSQRYGTISVPVELLHGTADEIVPLAVHSARLVNQIPGANLVTLPGIGHMPHHAAPDALDAAIDRAAARAGLR